MAAARLSEAARARMEQDALFRDINNAHASLRQSSETKSVADAALCEQLITRYRDAHAAAAREAAALSDALERLRGQIAKREQSAAAGAGAGAAATSAAAAAVAGAKKGKPDAKHSSKQTKAKARKSDADDRDRDIWSHNSNLPLAPGTRVAALVDAHSRPRIWIEASVLEWQPARQKYRVIDEDPGDAQNPNPLKKKYLLNAIKVVPLHALDTYSIWQRKEFARGTDVLALFPNTTVFYPAKVLAGPRKRKTHDYLLAFDDDDVDQRTAEPQNVFVSPDIADDD